MTKWQKILISFTIPLLAAAIGSAFTVTQIPTWYADLLKPSFNPPNWLFGPVWTILYLLMGYALYLVWIDTKAKKKTKQLAVMVFAGQLTLNVIWSITFFGAHNLMQSTLAIVVLWLAILWNILAFNKVSRAAACALVPYIMWVTFASLLNIAIWRLNM